MEDIRQSCQSLSTGPLQQPLSRGPRNKEGQRAIRLTPICAAPWSRWCKQAVRSVNWLTNVHFLASVQYPVTAILRRRLRWVGRIDAGLRKRTAKLVGPDRKRLV